MKGILSKIATILSIIGGFAALIGLYFQWQSRQHEMGGMLNASYQSRLLNNRESRTIFVCLEDTTIDLSNLYVTPTFDNPSQYSINDFSLTYSTESNNVKCKPSSFYQVHTINNQENIYKYSERVLDAHGESPKPFINFHIKGNIGRCLIRAKATYDGAPSAFEYTTDIWFIVEPQRDSLSLENWKLNCKKKIYSLVNESFYDVYYLSKGMPTEYQFDVALSNVNSIDQYSAQNDTLLNIVAEQNKENLGIEDNLPSTITINHYHIEKQKNSNNIITVYTNELLEKDETIYVFYDYQQRLRRYSMYNKINLLRGQNKFSFELYDGVDDIEELYICRKVPINLVANIEIEDDNTAIITGRTKAISIYELPYSSNSNYSFCIFKEGSKSISIKESDISKLRAFISDRDFYWSTFSISFIYAYIRAALPIMFHSVGIVNLYYLIIMLRNGNYRYILKHDKTRQGYYRLISNIVIFSISMIYLCWLIFKYLI